jgi:hypothetical protein
MAIVFHIEGHFFALFYFFSYLTWQYVMCTTWCITSFMQCLCHIIYLVLQHKLWHPINLQHYMITYVSTYIMMYMINFLSCFVLYFTWCFVTEWPWDSTISMSCFCYIILAILQHELWDISLSLWWFFKWHWAVWWSSEIMLALFHPHQNTDRKEGNLYTWLLPTEQNQIFSIPQNREGCRILGGVWKCDSHYVSLLVCGYITATSNVLG